eukprot:s25_g8.t1
MPLSDLWNAEDDPSEDAEALTEHQILKRRVRTEAARSAARVARRKPDATAAEAVESDGKYNMFARRLQNEHLSHSARSLTIGHRPYSDQDCQAEVDAKQQVARERARCVWSLLKALGTMVQNLLQPAGKAARHLVNVCTADDTSTSLKPAAGDRNVVCTIMNTVESALIRYDDGSWECMYIPTPLQVLNTSTASSIHASFVSWLLVSSSGVGFRWLSLGVQNNALQAVEWKSCIMVGDALKANACAWKAETKLLLSDSALPKTLGLRVKCSLHQLGLIRKPAVLSASSYWTTLVRLGHLYETHSIPVFEYPDEMAQWERRARWLQAGFNCTASKSWNAMLKDMMQFVNGDSTEPTLHHFCKIGVGGAPNCCDSDEESVCKLLSHLVPFWCRGYQTPLLYRMKHYGPAASFMKLGCCWFNFLPQALSYMEAARRGTDSEIGRLVDTFLADSGGTFPAGADFERLLADVLDSDESFAAKNGARRSMVVQEVEKPDFAQSSILIDAVINPMEFGVNFLLGHSKVLHNLSYVGRGHPDHEKLRKDANDKFLQVVTGRLGERIISQYIHFLETGLDETVQMGLDMNEAVLAKVMVLVLVCISDVYRRFIAEFNVPPWTLFTLLGQSTADFLASWRELEAKDRKCKACVDPQMTRQLLQHFPDLASKPADFQERACQEIQGLLQDITEIAPTGSDSVELKNGQVQWSASKRGRQNVKGQKSAAEVSLLHAATKSYLWAKDIAGAQTLPSKAVSSGIRKMAGTQRMPEDEKAAFQIEADYQQSLLDDLAQTPLPLKAETDEKKQHVWRNGAKKLSARRLELNTEAFQQHPLWSLPSQFADSFGAVKEAWIDVLSDDKDIAVNLGETLHQALDERPKGETDADAYLLGVMLKKPCMQILVEAAVIEEAANGISEIQLCSGTGIPNFRYPHEIFLGFCKGHLSSTLPDLTVKVEAWTCNAFFGEQRQVKIRSGMLISTFEVTVRKPVSRKPINVRMPFGLSIPKDKQVRKKQKVKKRIAKQKKGPQSKFPMPGFGAAEFCDMEPGSGSDSLSEESGGEVEVEQEVEHVVPASSTVAQEELQLASLRREMEAADSIRDQAAERIQAGKIPQSSFFSKEIGLDSGSIAVTGRAVCLTCKKPITKGSVRFSWYYSKVRPHGWIHSFCLLQHAKQTDLEQKTAEKLQKMTRPKAGQHDPGDKAVVEAAVNILKGLA